MSLFKAKAKPEPERLVAQVSPRSGVAALRARTPRTKPKAQDAGAAKPRKAKDCGKDGRPAHTAQGIRSSGHAQRACLCGSPHSTQGRPAPKNIPHGLRESDTTLWWNRSATMRGQLIMLHGTSRDAAMSRPHQACLCAKLLDGKSTLLSFNRFALGGAADLSRHSKALAERFYAKLSLAFTCP